MKATGRLKDLARIGAAALVAELQEQIDELNARFPGLTDDLPGRPRRQVRRRANTGNGRRTKARGPAPADDNTDRIDTRRLRRPLSGELKSFVLANGNLSVKQSDEARRLTALLAKAGILADPNTVAATLSRARRSQFSQYSANDKA